MNREETRKKIETKRERERGKDIYRNIERTRYSEEESYRNKVRNWEIFIRKQI